MDMDLNELQTKSIMLNQASNEKSQVNFQKSFVNINRVKAEKQPKTVKKNYDGVNKSYNL